MCFALLMNFLCSHTHAVNDYVRGLSAPLSPSPPLPLPPSLPISDA